LFLFFSQDVTHIAEGTRPRVGINVLDYGLSLAGFEVIIDGRFWVITEAMHLLQSGVDLTVIQRWLGHVQLATTHAYVEIDLEMKRKALAVCTPPVDTDNGLRKILDGNRDVISWLERL
jgi:hypothetical protein